MADVMTNDAFSDAAQTMTTMHDGMGKYDLKGLVAVRNTFLVCEEEAEEPTPLELRRGMSEPAPKVATMQGEEGEEEEEFDVLPPPSQLDRLQTLESWEDIKDWQYPSGNVSDPMPSYVDMSSQLLPPPPVEKGLSLEAMAQQPTGGQVYFPVPGVMPPAFAQNQPVQMMRPMQMMGQMQMPMGQQMQPMMQQPLQGMQQMQGMQAMQSMPGQQPQPMQGMQLTQPMQPNVPVVMPGWRPLRGNDLYMSVDPYSVRQQGGPSDLGTSPRPVNPDFDAAEMVGAPWPEEVPAAETLKVPEPLGLRQQLSTNSKVYRVHWTQPDKFLRSTNKNAVSPSFQIYGADWKLVLAADAPGRGDASFKVSKGRCSMKLKCENMSEDTTALTIMFRFFAGDIPVRGPAMHDFKNGTALAGLKRNDEAWDLLMQVKDRKVTVGVELWEVAYEVQGQ